MPPISQPTDLSNTKQPAPAVVVDVKLETEVVMKTELRFGIKVASALRTAKQFLAAWLCAVSDSVALNTGSYHLVKQKPPKKDGLNSTLVEGPGITWSQIRRELIEMYRIIERHKSTLSVVNTTL